MFRQTIFLKTVLVWLWELATVFATTDLFSELHDTLNKIFDLEKRSKIEIYKTDHQDDLNAVAYNRYLYMQPSQRIIRNDVEDDILSLLFRICKYCADELTIYLCSAVMVFLGNDKYYYPRNTRLMLDKVIADKRIEASERVMNIEYTYTGKKEFNKLANFFCGNEERVIGVREQVNYHNDCWYISEDTSEMLSMRRTDGVRLPLCAVGEDDTQMNENKQTGVSEEIDGAFNPSADSGW